MVKDRYKNIPELATYVLACYANSKVPAIPEMRHVCCISANVASKLIYFFNGINVRNYVGFYEQI